MKRSRPLVAVFLAALLTLSAAAFASCLINSPRHSHQGAPAATQASYPCCHEGAKDAACPGVEAPRGNPTGGFLCACPAHRSSMSEVALPSSGGSSWYSALQTSQALPPTALTLPQSDSSFACEPSPQHVSPLQLRTATGLRSPPAA